MRGHNMRAATLYRPVRKHTWAAQNLCIRESSCVSVHLLFGCRCVNVAAETLTDEAVAIHTKSSPTAPLTISSSFQTLLGGLKESLSVLTRSQLFFKLALIMAATGIVFECIMDLLFNYLILTMGFGASQISNVLMVLGICGLFVQARFCQWCTLLPYATFLVFHVLPVVKVSEATHIVVSLDSMRYAVRSVTGCT